MNNSEFETTPDLGLALQANVMKKAAALVAGAAVLGVSRAAQAAANGRTPVTAYFNNSPGGGAVQIPGTGDIKVLNYALALEDLEADLYRQAIARMTTGGTSGTGTQFSGLGIGNGADLQYLTEFGQVEAQHATLLRTTVTQAGGPVIPRFIYDFNMENRDRLGVMALVYAAELTGVSAYTGAIPSFATKTYLQVAAAILGTEARHTAAVAAVLNSSLYNVNPRISTAPLFNENAGKDTPLTPDQILYQGGTVSPSLTSPPGGAIGPVTGPNGFVYA